MNLDVPKFAVTLALIILTVLTARDILKTIPWWKLTILSRLIAAKQFSDLYSRTEWIIPLESASGKQNLAPMFTDVHGHCWADMTMVIPKAACVEPPQPPSK